MLERDAIADAARALEAQGFRIVGQPPASQTAWRPDLLAVRDGQAWAVEIKRVGVRISEEEINRLLELSDRQGWRLALWQMTPEGDLAGRWGDLQPRVSPDGEDDGQRVDPLRWVDTCQQVESGLRLVASLDNQDDLLRRVLEERQWGPEDEPLRPRHDPTARWPDLLADLAVAGYVDPGERVLFLNALDARDRLLRGFGEDLPSLTIGAVRRLFNALRNVMDRAAESWVISGGVFPGHWRDQDVP